VIRNSIIWGNTSNNIYIDTFSTATTFSYSLVEYSGGSGSWVAATGTDGTNNIDSNPQFAAPEPATSAPTSDGDYRLKDSPLSPAIDAGSDTLYPNTWAKWIIIPGLGASFTTPAFQTTIYDTYILPALDKDITGTTSRFNGTIDMGAYEY
jgi:hypothetical protein